MIGPFKGEYRWLSNFWPSPVMFEGCRYPTVEHAYQAAKTDSAATRRAICELPSPGAAKREGAAVVPADGWELRRVEVMADLLRQKFSHRELAQLLLATGEEELVEVNTWGDRFWGVCDGEGDNRLGRLLEQIRAELRSAAEPA